MFNQGFIILIVCDIVSRKFERASDEFPRGEAPIIQIKARMDTFINLPEGRRDGLSGSDFFSGETVPAQILRLPAGDSAGREPADPEIIILLEGEILISVDMANEERLDADMMVLLPPGCTAALRTQCGAYAVLLSIDITQPGCGLYSIGSYEGYETQTEGVLKPLRLNGAMKTYVSGLLPFLEDGMRSNNFLTHKTGEFVSIVRHYYSQAEQALFFSPLVGKDTVFRQFVHTHVRKAASVDELARFANMSRSGFFDRFRRNFGISPAVYLRNIKVKLICNELINTDVPLTSISQKYGFNTYEVFCKFVKKSTGHSPGRIRKSGIKVSLLPNSDK